MTQTAYCLTVFFHQKWHNSGLILGYSGWLWVFLTVIFKEKQYSLTNTTGYLFLIRNGIQKHHMIQIKEGGGGQGPPLESANACRSHNKPNVDFALRNAVVTPLRKAASYEQRKTNLRSSP